MKSMLLYIDPGTGSILFTVLLSILTTLFFLLQIGIQKLVVLFHMGKIPVIGVKANESIPILIFTDDKRYWEMFKPICDLFEKSERELHYWTCSEDDPALRMGYSFVKAEYVGNINAASFRLNRLNARICMTTTPGLGVYQWKKSRSTDWYVHLMHGAGDALCYKMFGLDEFDAILAVGRHQEEEIRKLEKVWGDEPKEIQLVGESHMDFLAQKYKEKGQEDAKEFCVLIAPSWGANAILSKYGEKLIDALLNTEYNIIIRPHPQSFMSEKDLLDRLMKKYPECDRIKWDLSNDNFEALRRSDIMISDFSSVIWDYVLVFDKPVIYADVSFDPSTYDLAWVNEERWDLQVLPLVGARLSADEFDNIGDYIAQTAGTDRFEDGRKLLREEAWANRGNSAEAVYEYLVSKYDKIMEDAVSKDA